MRPLQKCVNDVTKSAEVWTALIRSEFDDGDRARPWASTDRPSGQGAEREHNREKASMGRLHLLWAECDEMALAETQIAEHPIARWSRAWPRCRKGPSGRRARYARSFALDLPRSRPTSGPVLIDVLH